MWVLAPMRRRQRGSLINVEQVLEFFSHIMAEKPRIPFFVPLIFLLWAIERWIFSLSNWVPVIIAVWATIQYSNYRRQMLVDDLNKRWKRIILKTSPTTPLEHCEWLNKLLMEVWPNYLNPNLSLRFQSIVEKRLKRRKSRLMERIEIQEFSLGSTPPSLGLQGARWSTSGDKQVLRFGFDWDTDDMSIMLLARIAKPLRGNARIVINSLHIKGDVLFHPILDGKAILYSFASIPEVRIGVAFGSGGSQSLPATELPGVSSWLVKLLTDTLVRTMVEPRRSCLALPAVDFHKKAIGGVLYVTVISAGKLSRSSLKGTSSKVIDSLNELSDDKDLQTFVEVELGELTRRTDVRSGSNPHWNSTFNMILHDNTGILRLFLNERTPGSVKYDILASSEIKIRYVPDDSTVFWAIGSDSGIIAKRAEFCGDEVEMVVPFEGVSAGELTVKLVLKEWQFSDGSYTSKTVRTSSQAQQSVNGSSNFPSKTGRRISMMVVEGKDIVSKDKSGKCDPYVRLKYGKVVKRTRTAHSSSPVWNQKFEFDELSGECLKIKCYNEETFADDDIGSARATFDWLAEGLVRDVWIPLEKVNSGELRLQLEAVKVTDHKGSKGSSNGLGHGWVELVLVEARDLVAADRRGTSDPYVKVQYGNLKRRTKVIYKTLNPQWNQTLEFPDDGSPLVLHVKDHNALLPGSSIGDCVVEYQGLPPNQLADKWIPLQGVKTGEIHVQITRRVPELEKKQSLDSEPSLTKAYRISSQMKETMLKFQSLLEDENPEPEGLLTTLSELETLEDMQQEYMVQLEAEQMLLLKKIKELGHELFVASPSPSRAYSSS